MIEQIEHDLEKLVVALEEIDKNVNKINSDLIELLKPINYKIWLWRFVLIALAVAGISANVYILAVAAVTLFGLSFVKK